MKLNRCLLPLGACLIIAGCSTSGPKGRQSAGPWDLDSLYKTPVATWGATNSNAVQEVYYVGEPFQGKPTRIFAYYAVPQTGFGPFPAMVLVHGGGGKAFPDWARHWAQRGYAALAMDLSGRGPDSKPLPDGGPDQNDGSKFRNFTADDTRDMWSYHSVAAVIRGHSLLASRPEVDAGRIGITGISWGGYLTCIVAGLDKRLRVAVPVYGCGYLLDNSCWLTNFARMNPDSRERWVELFDPSMYLGAVDCPILFLNGSNDFAYPLDSYKKSYDLVRGRRTVCVKIRMPHGHIWTFREVDCFVDSVLQDAPPLPVLSRQRLAKGIISATAQSDLGLQAPELHYTTDTGEWRRREWKSVPATFQGKTIQAQLPPERPLVCFLSITDERGVAASTPHEVYEAPKNN